MRTAQPYNRYLVLGKIVVGILSVAIVAGADSNGISARDLIVGGGMAASTTVALITAIEQGASAAIAGHISIGCLIADVATGVWLNVSPYLDQAVHRGG